MKDHEKRIKNLEKLAVWMDSRFTIPGTNIQLGMDSILGLIPGIGDTLTLGSTAYFYGFATSLNLPWHVKGRILWNGFIDWLIGLIPFFGDIFDIGWKSNLKNIELIKSHMHQSADQITQSSTAGIP